MISKYNLRSLGKSHRTISDKIENSPFNLTISYDQVRESEKKDELIHAWKEMHKSNTILKKIGCVYLCLVVIRRPLMTNDDGEISREEFAMCFKVGSTTRSVYERMCEFFDEFNVIWIVPICIMHNNEANVTGIESEIKQELNRDLKNGYQLCIGCNVKQLHIKFPREFYAVNNNVLDTMLSVCLDHDMKKVYFKKAKKVDDYFDILDKNGPNIAEHYSVDAKTLLMLDDQSNNISNENEIKKWMKQSYDLPFKIVNNSVVYSESENAEELSEDEDDGLSNDGSDDGSDLDSFIDDENNLENYDDTDYEQE